MTADLGKVAGDSARGALFLASGNIISMIISAISVFITARLLGAELYGVYAISLTIPTLLLLFVDFGINQALTHFSASLQVQKKKGGITKLLRHGLLYKTLISVIILAVTQVFADVFATHLLNRPECGSYIRLASLAIVFQTVFSTAGAVFMGLDHPGYLALTTTIQALVKATASSLLVLLGQGVLGAITGFVIAQIISAVISAILLFTKVCQPFCTDADRGDPSNALKMMLGYGVPLYLSSLLLGLSSQLQRIILANFAPDTAIGNYKASNNFIILLTSLTGAVVTSLLPAFSKLYKNMDQAKILYTVANKYSTLLILPVTTLLLLLSHEVIHVIYGPSYQAAPLYLSLSVTPFFLAGLGRFTLASFFQGHGETRVSFTMTLLYFLASISLSLPLAKIYSIPGLILATLIAASAETILGVYVAKKRFQAQPDYNNITRIFLTALVSTLPALLTTRLLPLSPLLIIIISGLIYLLTYITLIPVARIINRLELETISQLTDNFSFLKVLTNPIIAYELKLIENVQ